MKALIAIDGSADAACAMRAAGHLLTPIDRNLDLLCVAPAPVRRRKGEPRREYERRILEEARQILERARADLPPGPGPLTLLTEIGSPAAVIVSRSGDYDLVVIGSKGKGVAGEVGLGPVASRVLEHAAGAVLVGREFEASEGGVRVLAPVDGSAASLYALDRLNELFDLNAAEVCLMHITETPWIHLGLEEDWYTASEEEQETSEPGAFEKEMVREGQAVLDRARTRLHSPRYSVITQISEGNPADEILSEAERGEYDLIVLGATGSRDLKHRMLGSVSTKVAWSAPCSVLVVREPEEAG